MKKPLFIPSLALILIHFFLLDSKVCVGQQPGGVQGTRIWYKTALTGSKLTDYSGNKFEDYKPVIYRDLNRSLNFHPALFMSQNNNITVTYTNQVFNQGTIVGMFYPYPNTNWNEPIALVELKDSSTRYSIRPNRVDTNARKEFSFGSPLQRTTFIIDGNYTKPATAMKTGVFHFSTTKASYSVWGENRSASFTTKFDGYIPELIFYNRVLSPLEIAKVQTYLAIKYGTTLDTSYIIGEGTPIWNIQDPAIKKFHHRVCAIAVDMKSALQQVRSNSSYDEGYLPFAFNSSFTKADLNGTNFTTIPKTDSPSVYRSLTIGFSNPASVRDVSYIVWGDDNTLIGDDPYVMLDPANHLETVGRIWMLRNPTATNTNIKMMLAGKTYSKNSRRTLFEKMYAPYDYQFYRYLFIELKNPSVKDTNRFMLNQYFGREQSIAPRAENFNTRFLVWDSIAVTSKTDVLYFTFGRVPLLSFWEVTKIRGRLKNKINLKYFYDRNLPLPTETRFDTAVTNFLDGDSLQIKISRGVTGVVFRIKEDRPSTPWKVISDTSSVSVIEFEEPEPTGPVTPTPSQPTPLPDSTDSERSPEEIKGDKRYIIKRKWKPELPAEYLMLKGLKPGVTYILEATDRLGQRSTLVLRIKKHPDQR